MLRASLLVIAVGFARTLLGCVAPPPSSPGAATPARSEVSSPTCSGRTFILVRHAEKASNADDPPLSERGRARAAALADLLSQTRITRLLASQRRRTQETLAPLAERRGLTVEQGPATDKAALLTELRRTPDGAAVVVATHSNVLPYVVRELGGTPLHGVAGDDLEDTDFGRLAIVIVPCEGRPSVVELSTGK